MIRPAFARLAACLSTGLVASVLPVLGTAPATAGEPGETPLEVSIDSLTPSSLAVEEPPRRGARRERGEQTVTVTGQVTNRSDSTWTDLNVYLLTSASPLTSTTALTEATATPAESDIGDRLTGQGQFVDLGDLRPGASASYRLDVPRSELEIGGQPGVYWLGVHVLGANEVGRDSVADGRARTFLPLMDPDGPSTRLALLMPLMAPVPREPDGRLVDATAWQERLTSDGRLGRLVDLTGTAGDTPVTWLLDPAVVEAARSVALDDPPVSTAPTVPGGDGTADADDLGSNPTTGPDGTATASPEPDAADGETDPEPSAEALVAQEWLATFARLAEEHTVLTVPYGDLDVASVMRSDFGRLYERAVELSGLTMATLGVDADPVLAPPSGYLPRVALEQVDPDVPVVLTDGAAPGARRSVLRSRQGNQVVLTSSAVSAGGPLPQPRHSPLALRQRILAEAAVHALTGDLREPLVVSTPEQWDPGTDWRSASFFAGLDVPWLDPASLPSVVRTAGVLDPTGYQGRLTYPRPVRRAELPTPNLLATDELVDAGNVLADLLTLNDTVDEAYARIAMLASSVRARPRPRPAVLMARDASQLVHAQLERVRIAGPSFVTMSSEKGSFAVTVINDLDEPVTVAIEPNTGSEDLVIPAPEPVDLGPNQRASVRLNATAQDIGVHSVTLVPVTLEGHPLGNTTKFSVRSSQVGFVIWLIIGAGGGVLLVAIAVRIVRRVRRRRATPGPLLEETRR